MDEPVTISVLLIEEFNNRIQRRIPKCSSAKIFIKSNEKFFGPFCKNNRVQRHATGDFEIESQTFQGKEIDLVYAVGPAGEEYHFRLHFEWRLANTTEKCPISLFTAEMSLLAQPILSVGSIGEFELYQKVLTTLDRLDLLASDPSFNKCTTHASNISCSFLDTSYELQTVDELLNRVKGVIDSIKFYCKEEFIESLNLELVALYDQADTLKQGMINNTSPTVVNSPTTKGETPSDGFREPEFCPWPQSVFHKNDNHNECDLAGFRICNMPIFVELVTREGCENQKTSLKMNNILQEIQNGLRTSSYYPKSFERPSWNER